MKNLDEIFDLCQKISVEVDDLKECDWNQGQEINDLVYRIEKLLKATQESVASSIQNLNWVSLK